MIPYQKKVDPREDNLLFISNKIPSKVNGYNDFECNLRSPV